MLTPTSPPLTAQDAANRAKKPLKACSPHWAFSNVFARLKLLATSRQHRLPGDRVTMRASRQLSPDDVPVDLLGDLLRGVRPSGERA